MSDFFEGLEQEHVEFIDKQKIFFTASAPEEGRVNLSPKGMESFVCLNENEVAYLDVVGSGNETAAHLKQNGRLTIMFCSFDKQPLILRLYGKGKVVQPDDKRWKDMTSNFPKYKGVRQIIVLKVDSVQTSCGYGVPRMDFIGERPTLKKWADKKTKKELRDYQVEKNSKSIDGLSTGLHVKKLRGEK